MSVLAIIQAAQTAALLTVAGAIIYALILMRSELRRIREGLTELQGAFLSQKQFNDAVERIWNRMDEIETMHGMRIDFEELTRFKRLIDGLEATAKKPPATDTPD